LWATNLAAFNAACLLIYSETFLAANFDANLAVSVAAF
jgi:hypothetical protein